MVNRMNLRDHVTRFYKSESFPDSKAERLVEIAKQTRIEGEMSISSSGSNWRPQTWIRFTAAASLLVMTGLYMIVGTSAIKSDRKQVVQSGLVEGNLGMELSEKLAHRLVAVEIRADWCARTPEVAPIFDNLTTEYGDQPILFVTLDITDNAGRQQSRLKAENLGITSVYDAPFESGMVKLIDREEGQVLAVLTGEEDWPKMEGMLALALPLHP